MRNPTLLAGLLALAAACQTNRDATRQAASSQGVPTPAASAEVSAQLDKLQQQESDVLARRDELKREREQVTADRAALLERRKQVVAQGGDVKAIDAEDEALVAREAKLVEQETELDKKVSVLLAAYQGAATAGTGEPVTRREAQVASREKDLARRESGLAAREAELAARERAQAQRERETCSAPQTIVQQVPAPSSGKRYSRRDVEPILQGARRKMSEKGLLASDLPPPAKVLEKEATEAIGDGEYGRAKFAAEQLYAMVESIKVDRQFIVAKINRLNAAVKAKQLAGDDRNQVDALFRDATADYGDGKYSAANGKLNRIYGILQ